MKKYENKEQARNKVRQIVILIEQKEIHPGDKTNNQVRNDPKHNYEPKKDQDFLPIGHDIHFPPRDATPSFKIINTDIIYASDKTRHIPVEYD